MSTHNKYNFAVDDIVFAKVKGYPYWPAIITNILHRGMKTYYNVIFFGPFHVSEVIKENNICFYKENIEKYGILKTENFKNASFNAALQEVEFYLSETSNIIRDSDDLNKKNHRLGDEVGNNEICNFQSENVNNFMNDQNNTSNDFAFKDQAYLEEHFQNIKEKSCSNALSLDPTIKDHYEEHSILDNVAEKLQTYDDLAEIDVETSLALAAEVGNALLVENNQIKKDITKFTTETSELKVLLEEEQKKNQFLTHQINEILANQSDYCSELEETLGINEQIVIELTEKNICSQREITYLKNKLNAEQVMKDDLLEQYESERSFLTAKIYELESINASFKSKIDVLVVKNEQYDGRSFEMGELEKQLVAMLDHEEHLKEELNTKNMMLQSVTSKQVEFLGKIFDLENFLESLLTNIKDLLEIEYSIPTSDQITKKCFECMNTTSLSLKKTTEDTVEVVPCDEIIVKESMKFNTDEEKQHLVSTNNVQAGGIFEDFLKGNSDQYIRSSETVEADFLDKGKESANDNESSMACYDRAWGEQAQSSSLLSRLRAQDEQRRRMEAEDLQRRAYNDTWKPWESICTSVPVPEPPAAPQSFWGNDVWAPPPPPDTWAPPGLAPRPPPRLEDPNNPELDIGLDYDPFRSHIWAPQSTPNNFWKPPTTN